MSNRKIIEQHLTDAEKNIARVKEVIDKSSEVSLREETGGNFVLSCAIINQNRAIIALLQDLGQRVQLVETALGLIAAKSDE
jgi:hypothetical protein